jgi:pimeloyl-ACP methyl ester carboxylesterase
VNVIEQTGAKDAVLVGFSMGGGEVTRYMSRHKGKSVTKAVLVAASLPYRLKTSDNPLGIEQTALDQMLRALNEDRPKFLATFFQKFFYGVRRFACRQPSALGMGAWCIHASQSESHTGLCAVIHHDRFSWGIDRFQSANPCDSRHKRPNCAD